MHSYVITTKFFLKSSFSFFFSLCLSFHRYNPIRFEFTESEINFINNNPIHRHERKNTILKTREKNTLDRNLSRFLIDKNVLLDSSGYCFVFAITIFFCAWNLNGPLSNLNNFQFCCLFCDWKHFLLERALCPTSTRNWRGKRARERESEFIWFYEIRCDLKYKTRWKEKIDSW